MLNLLLNKKRFKIYILLSIDLIILPLSVLIAFWTRIGELFWVPEQEFLFLFIFVYFSPIIIFIPLGYLFGLYKVIIRFLDLIRSCLMLSDNDLEIRYLWSYLNNKLCD